jgi:hypothetical protein
MRNFHIAVAVLFIVVGTLHLLRAILGGEVTIDGNNIPVWVSWILGLLALYFAYTALKLNK